MKNTLLYSLFSLLVPGLFFMGCDKDDPVIPVEEELITTLILNLKPSGGGTSAELQFRDLDGDGGNPPVFQTEPLESNTVYDGHITLLNESVSPVEDVTKEIKSGNEEHQFFFRSDIPGIEFDYLDMDPKGDPVGLQMQLRTAQSGSGTLTITLRHLPDKSAPGVAAGDITQAGGETDIEVNFDVEIQ